MFGTDGSGQGQGVARRLLTFALALALVSTAILSGVGGPTSPTGTAAADWSEECDLGDSLLGAAFNTIVGSDSGCRWESGSSTDWQNMTATQGYGEALAMSDSTSSYVAQTGNFMQDSRTVSASKAKIETINGLNNGTSEAVTENRVNETIREYYSQIQLNLIRDHEARLTQFQNLIQSGVTYKVSWTPASSDPSDFSTYSASEFVLANGTSVSVSGVRMPESSGATTSFSMDQTTDGRHYVLKVKDPDADSWVTVLDSRDYTFESGHGSTGEKLLMESSEQNQWAIDNFQSYISGVYAEYDPGEINSTTLAMNDPTVIAAEASTDLNSTGYYGYAAVQLASIGAQGDLNVSHSVDVFANSSATAPTESWNGTLMYTGSDASEGWNTSERYNVSDYNGTFYFVVSPSNANESARVVDVSQHGSEFNLTSATNTRTGEAVETTETQKFVYDTANASALAEEIDRLEQLRQQYENANTGGSGGFSFDFGGTSTGMIVALLAVVFLLGRN